MRLRSSGMIVMAAALLAVLADEPAAAVVAVGDRQIDRQHLHLERVAGLGAFDEHRPGEDVPARAAIRHRRDDGAQRGLHVLGLDAGLLEAIGRGGEQRVHVEDVARRDAQHRLRLGPVVAVRHRGRAWLRADGCAAPGRPADPDDGDDGAAAQGRSNERAWASRPQAAGRGRIRRRVVQGGGSRVAIRGLAIKAPHVASGAAHPFAERDQDAA